MSSLDLYGRQAAIMGLGGKMSREQHDQGVAWVERVSGKLNLATEILRQSGVTDAPNRAALEERAAQIHQEVDAHFNTLVAGEVDDYPAFTRDMRAVEERADDLVGDAKATRVQLESRHETKFIAGMVLAVGALGLLGLAMTRKA
jgi:hypothetical protein